MRHDLQLIVAAGVVLSGCFDVPAAGDAGDAGVAEDAGRDAAAVVPDVPPANDADGSDTIDAESALDDSRYFPVPRAGSGESAWWLMRWNESPGRAEEDRCPAAGAEYFGVLVRDDGQIPGAVTITYVRDFPCMYWGGGGANDLQYHVARQDTGQYGPMLMIVGSTIRERNPVRPVAVTLDGETQHTFPGSADEPLDIAEFEPSGEWRFAYPMVPVEPLQASLAFGANTQSFDAVGDRFQLVTYPDEESRRTQTGGTDGVTLGLHVRFRRTIVNGVETQYVLTSFDREDGLRSCEETWYQKGRGLYALAAYQAPTFQECSGLAASEDPDALADPEAHFLENADDLGGWGIREDFCIGERCGVQ